MPGADWVAASVRARSIADRRAGAGLSRRVATQPTLSGALTLLDGSAYSARLSGADSLATAQRAVSETVLWELRVLAGWMPVDGAPLARAMAAAFERDNIVARAGLLRGGDVAAPHYFELGALATAWPRVLAAASAQEVVDVLRRSPWGDPGECGSPGALADALAVLWMRRMVDVAPEVRTWAQAACALMVARALLVDRISPTERLAQLLRPLIGTSWTQTGDLESLRAGLPSSARSALDDVETPNILWKAEARLGGVIEAEGVRLLRGSLPGPGIIVGAMAVLAVDSWRTRAALGAASAGAGADATAMEVIDVMA